MSSHKQIEIQQLSMKLIELREEKRRKKELIEKIKARNEYLEDILKRAIENPHEKIIVEPRPIFKLTPVIKGVEPASRNTE